MALRRRAGRIVRGRAVVLLAVVVAGGVLVPVAAAGADDGSGVVLPPAGLSASDCAGQAPIVVGSDAAAQSDIYSAVTLAGVVGSDCVVLAGPRDGPMAASQRARLDAAAEGGFVVGGIAAVPAAKLAGRDMTRLAGADRWSTAQQVGSRARMLGGDGGVPDAPALDYSLRVPDDVRQPGVHLHGAAPWIASDCAGDAPIVVGSDANAQSDIYSAVTLAGVVGTDCVVLAGPRDGPMAASQQARLDAAAGGGFVVGGIAAVPTAKLADRDMTRLAGTDRWETARLVGRRASGDTTAGTSTADEPTDLIGDPEATDGHWPVVRGGTPPVGEFYPAFEHPDYGISWEAAMSRPASQEFAAWCWGRFWPEGEPRPTGADADAQASRCRSVMTWFPLALHPAAEAPGTGACLVEIAKQTAEQAGGAPTAATWADCPSKLWEGDRMPDIECGPADNVCKWEYDQFSNTCFRWFRAGSLLTREIGFPTGRAISPGLCN